MTASAPSVHLPTRRLGSQGPEIPALGLGLMGLSAFYGTKKPDEERLAFLSAAYDMGAVFWDSADIYQDNEDLLGKWFKANPGKREHIFLATKFALTTDASGKMIADTSAEYARKACEKSLSRLGTDYIDLYYAHRLDGKTPVEKTVEALAQLKKEGKIRHIGLSECTAEGLRRACKVAHIDALQIEYSPWELMIESEQTELLATCRELGIAVIPYSPIGRGMLTGTIRSPEDFPKDDWRRAAPRFSKENFPTNLKLVDEIQEIASRKGLTATQVALAWILAQGKDLIPIPGTTRQERLKENLGALNVTLTPNEVQEIRALCEKATVKGDRYPDAMMKSLLVETPAMS